MSPSARFDDPRQFLSVLMREALVVCPKCGGRAESAAIDRASTDSFAPRRVSCAACGFTRRWRKSEVSGSRPGDASDDYFRLPLWLQTACGGQVLWACTRRHLELLEGFVSTKLRERKRISRCTTIA